MSWRSDWASLAGVLGSVRMEFGRRELESDFTLRLAIAASVHSVVFHSSGTLIRDVTRETA